MTIFIYSLQMDIRWLFVNKQKLANKWRKGKHWKRRTESQRRRGKNNKNKVSKRMIAICKMMMLKPKKSRLISKDNSIVNGKHVEEKLLAYTQKALLILGLFRLNNMVEERKVKRIKIKNLLIKILIIGMY